MRNLLSLVLFCFLPFIGSTQTLKDYEGVFLFDGAPFASIVITHSNGTLSAEAESLGKGDLKTSSNKDEFTEPNYNATLKFQRDETGNVIGVTVSAMGEKFEGKKSSPFDEYLGSYSLDEPLNEVKLVLKNGNLFGISAMGESSISKTSTKDKFTLDSYDGTILFIRDTKGNISTVEVAVQGSIFKGEKK